MLRLPDITDSRSFWDRLSAEHGQLALDVGANIGQAAQVLSKNFETVHAFEPCAEALSILALEVPANVTIHPIAASAHDYKIMLDECENSIRTGQLTTGSALGWGPVIGQREVNAITLDTFCRGRNLVPDLVKIDTEGHELQVLLGAYTLLRKHRTTWFVEVHSKVNDDLCRCSFGAGYEVERVEHDLLVGAEREEHFYLIARPR